MYTLLGYEPTLVVVSARVASMLRLVDVREVDAEEGVREVPWTGRVREVEVDDEHGEEGYE